MKKLKPYNFKSLANVSFFYSCFLKITKTAYARNVKKKVSEMA